MRAYALALGLVLIGVTSAHAQKLLADANNDGKVTLTEYQNSRRTFLMRGDQNKDGKLSPDEWSHGAAKLRTEIRDTGTPGWSLIGKAGIFAELDANKDNAVTPAEIDTLSRARFPQFDLNHDGVVDRKEAAELDRRAPKL